MERRNLTQVYLLTSILILSLLIRLFLADAQVIIDAMFATMSTPVIYTMSYYMREARRAEGGEFVKRKKPSLSRMVTYEIAAMIASYMTGFIVFYSLSGVADYYTYTIAYLLSQTLRAVVHCIIRAYEALGADPGHPLLMLVGAVAAAALHLLILLIIYRSSHP